MQLTLLAFYYQPESACRAARAVEARAQVPVAEQRLPFGVKPLVAHHSQKQDYSNSPWSLGFEVEIPLASAARQQAMAERAGYLAQAAELEVGSTAWSVRSRVRAAMSDLAPRSSVLRCSSGMSRRGARWWACWRSGSRRATSVRSK